VATTLLSVIWGAVFLVRRSMVAPAVSHALFNLTEVFRYTLYRV
jgi:membrane protease YdiL (CAAX protease family)